jgi:hypothetical protein
MIFSLRFFICHIKLILAENSISVKGQACEGGAVAEALSVSSAAAFAVYDLD